MNRRVSKWLGLGVALAVSLVWGGAVMADVTLPAIFGDHMVLQADQPIPVWGRAEPQESVTVRLGEAETSTVANAQGNWQVRLPARKAGADLTLRIHGANTLEFADVLVGEVWLGSGQSNMQWPVADSDPGSNAWPPSANAQMRFFTAPRTASLLPQWEIQGSWQVCTSTSAAAFSAVAYYFGCKLQSELHVPVGLINASLTGTRIEPWTPYGSLSSIPDYGPELAKLDALRAEIEAKLKAFDPQREQARRAFQEALAMEADESQGAAIRQSDFDDSQWPAMEVSGLPWEKTAFTNQFDGLVWCRKTIELPADWAGQDLVLHLGPVDETDVTWFNTTRIGGMGRLKNGDVQYWDGPRVYRVPGSAVKAGRNVITVRVIDTAYAGGLCGAKPEEMKLVRASGSDTRSVGVSGPWKYRAALQFIAAPKATTHSETPSGLFNAMIHPLAPYGIRGVIWYQGESNVSDGDLYTHKMRAVIEGWRAVWGQGDFPFYYVQLAPYHYGDAGGAALPKLWNAQRKALAIPHTGMAVTTDLGNLRDIHPRRKIEVGERLARWALAKTYGRTALVYTGPLLQSVTRESRGLRLAFDGVGGGLVGRKGPSLDGFDLAGADGVFGRAQATITGDTVSVESEAVPEPITVRYGFTEGMEAELFNAEGLPASPFEAGL